MSGHFYLSDVAKVLQVVKASLSEIELDPAKENLRYKLPLGLYAKNLANKDEFKQPLEDIKAASSAKSVGAWRLF